MRFVEWPWAIALGIVLPILGFLIFNLEGRSRAKRLGKLGPRTVLVRLAPLGAAVGMWRIVRLTAALLLLGLAFAGPRWGVAPSESRGIGVDVVLALDASLSMEAQDAPPSRLENMKNVVRQLRTLSPTDRFAILAFAGHSYVLSPLTTDQSAIDLYIDKLDPSTVGVAGSSIANAIHQATTLLSTRKDAGDRVIIVMSDGESFEPRTAVSSEARRASEAGISMVTVGFGTAAGATIPVRDSTGKMTTKTDRTGGVVTTHYMPEYLNAAAQAARGTFVPAEAANKAAQIRRVLDGMKTSPRTTAGGSDLLGKFEWFVFPALFLLALDTILMLRPRRRRMAVATATAVGMLATAACQPSGPKAPSAAQVSANTAAANAKQETARLLQYNRGRRVFGPLATIKRDTLLATNAELNTAREGLDSATQARTLLVRDRALYNAGWSRLVLSARLLGLIQPPKAKPSGDTAITNKNQTGAAKPPTAVAQAAATDSAATGTKMSDSAVRAAKRDTAMAYLNTARAQYRAYLVAHPDDRDAKWNYEMTLGAGGGGNGNGRPNGRPRPRPQPRQPRPRPAQPPPQKFKLPPQEAKQMLQAASQREQSPSPAKATPTAVVPGGNDW